MPGELFPEYPETSGDLSRNGEGGYPSPVPRLVRNLCRGGGTDTKKRKDPTIPQAEKDLEAAFRSLMRREKKLARRIFQTPPEEDLEALEAELFAALAAELRHQRREKRNNA